MKTSSSCPLSDLLGIGTKRNALVSIWPAVLAFLSVAALVLAGPAAQAWERETKLAADAPVDIAPWGERTSWENGKDAGLLGEDPRDVQRVVVVFAGTPPDPAGVRLQWWQSQWPDRRIPRDRLAGAGESGWLNIGDWYQGRWREADSILKTDGKTWTYTFQPVNAKEFPNLKDFAADYRTTLKLRLLFNETAPKIESLQTFSDSTWKKAEMALEWGGTAGQPENWDGQLEILNGFVDRIEPLPTAVAVALNADGSWKSEVKGQTSGVRARIWLTQSPNLNSFDKTVVTLRAGPVTPVSFDAAEVAGGGRVFVPAFGLLVRRADDSDTYATALARWKARTTKPIYERVFDEPEQTFARAMSEMPPKRQFYIPLGCAGGRQRFGVDPDGSVFCVNDRIDQPKGKDTPRRTWGGNRLRYRFGLPEGTPAKRWIEEQSLPIIHAQWERNGIRYTQTAFATRLDPGSLGPPDMQADDTTVLMVKMVAENTRAQSAPAALTLSLEADGRPLELTTRDGLVFAKLSSGAVMRCALETPPEATVAMEAGKIVCEGEMPADERAEVFVKIPFITLDQPAELERLRNLNFEDELRRAKDFWLSRANASTQIRTPVNEINNFYRAHVSHLLINCGREVGADRLMARVGSFGYGVYGNESCMMITDLDRRGLHQEAERCLETFLHYQGTSDLPGDYSSQEGVFNGAGGWESGGYNQHHGWIMWAMAEHYWHSGDAAWLKKNAGKLVKACD